MNAVVPSGDLVIVLEFNSRIDRARSRLALQAPDGTVHAVTLSDSPANVLGGHADAGEGGAWILQWQVLSQDGHITRGDIPFSVRPR